MTQQYVQPGQTYVLSGTVTSDGFAYAEGGRTRGTTTGGVILVSGKAVNDGFLGAGEGYSKPGAEGKIAVTGVLTNNGTINLAGGMKAYGLPASGGYMSNSGTFTNAGYVILYGGGSYGYPDRGTGATLNNTGVMTNAATIVIAGAAAPTNGGGILLDAGQLSNTGTIDVNSGRDASSGNSPNSGTIAVTGTLHSKGEILLRGGEDGNGAGAQMNISGVAFNTGLIVADSGSGGLESAPDTGATISVAGVLHNIGQIDIDGGEVVDRGTGTPGALIDSGLLRNSGTILLTQQGSFYYLDGSVTVTTTGVLSNTGTITGDGTLVNNGIINSGLNGSTTGVISATYFVNEGEVDVVPNSSLLIGDFVVNDGFSPGHTGVFDLLANSTLTEGSFFGGQEVSFIGSHATLVMGDLHDFTSILDVEKSHSTIDFLGQDITAAQASGNYLELTLANGTFRDLYTTAISAGTSLTLLTDGRGGTDLVFTHVGSPQHASVPGALYPTSTGILSAGASHSDAGGLDTHFVSPQ